MSEKIGLRAGRDGEQNSHETKTAKDIMTPVESAFSVPLESNLDWQVPLPCLLNLFEETIGFYIASCSSFRADTPLHEIFILFRKKCIHMATVVKVIDVSVLLTQAQEEAEKIVGRAIGIITFEDVIKELLKVSWLLY
ncbi:hypothetical protein LXL04_036995 [Taraxacum kok-saghyz]